jgi:hypothetical protein
MNRSVNHLNMPRLLHIFIITKISSKQPLPPLGAEPRSPRLHFLLFLSAIAAATELPIEESTNNDLFSSSIYAYQKALGSAIGRVGKVALRRLPYISS